MFGLLYAALSLLAVGGALAAPSPSPTWPPASSSCISDDTASALATAYGDLIGEPFNKTLAKHALIPEFTDYSDSVIELINNGCPTGEFAYGTAEFTNRTFFEELQATQAPIPFQILNIWPGCDTVTFRWRSSTPGTVEPEVFVTGIIVLEVVPNTEHPDGQFDWKIDTVYSEFNSGAWLYDLGIFKPANCTS